VKNTVFHGIGVFTAGIKVNFSFLPAGKDFTFDKQTKP